MRILFVCWSNIGRSQMAHSMYTRLYDGQADSAGTEVPEQGQILDERLDDTTQTILAAMRELDIDMSRKTRTQVVPEMLENYDRVIVISEPEHTPSWLESHPKAERWLVPDPSDISLAETRKIRDLVRKQVAALV